MPWAKHRDVRAHVRNVRRRAGEKMVRVPVRNTILRKRKLKWMKLTCQCRRDGFRRWNDMICAARIAAAHEQNRHARPFESKRPLELTQIGHLHGRARRRVLKQQCRPRAFDTCVPRTVPKAAIEKDCVSIVHGGLNKLGRRNNCAHPIEHSGCGCLASPDTVFVRNFLNGFSDRVRSCDQLKRGFAARVFDSDPDRHETTAQSGTFDIAVPRMNLVWSACN